MLFKLLCEVGVIIHTSVVMIPACRDCVIEVALRKSILPLCPVAVHQFVPGKCSVGVYELLHCLYEQSFSLTLLTWSLLKATLLIKCDISSPSCFGIRCGLAELND